MKVLAIGAHPDDIEIFMFGFLYACTIRKDDVYLAIATDGGAGNIMNCKNLVRVREKETKTALLSLGEPLMLGLPDGSLSNSKIAYNKINDCIKSIKPDLIITHAPEDYHPDHIELSRLVVNATGFLCPVIFADTLMGVNFTPDYYIDITNYFELKSKAILTHESQNPLKFLDATKLLNRFRSAQCNAPKENYAEAYRIEKKFPFADIRSLLPSSPDINKFYNGSAKSLI